jgi:hypothetical protein
VIPSREREGTVTCRGSVAATLLCGQVGRGTLWVRTIGNRPTRPRDYTASTAIGRHLGSPRFVSYLNERKMSRNSLALLFCCALAAAPALADVTPSALFSGHMVLQSGVSVPVWGKADPGEKVTVAIQDQTQSATADASGKWMVRLSNLKTGGPLEMTIAGKNTITVKDALIGEVWLGSGQSNMEFTVSKKVARFAGLVNEDDEIAAANYPKIRIFTEKQSKKYEPQSDLTGEWKICSPDTVPGFSAVGYLFARDLQRELGGTPLGFLTVAIRRQHRRSLDSPRSAPRRPATQAHGREARHHGDLQ